MTPKWHPFSNEFYFVGNVARSLLAGRVGKDRSNLRVPRSDDDLFSMVEASIGAGYSLQSNLMDIDLEAGYKSERLDSDMFTNNFEAPGGAVNNFYNYQGYLGVYGKLAMRY